MALPALKVTGINKLHREKPILVDLNFEVYPGEILGILGPNGSGKTTLLRILATVVKPTSGSVLANQISQDTLTPFRKQIGYMPDFLGDYDDMTVRDMLNFFARAYQIPRKQAKERQKDVLATVDLSHRLDHLVHSLTSFQSRQLALARILLHNPTVLLLDEPLSALNPSECTSYQKILTQLAQQGQAIVVTSNCLEDLIDLCEQIALLDQGHFVATVKSSDLLKTRPEHPRTKE